MCGPLCMVYVLFVMQYVIDCLACVSSSPMMSIRVPWCMVVALAVRLSMIMTDNDKETCVYCVYVCAYIICNMYIK